MPTKSLISWIAADKFDDLFNPWDFSSILCDHGQLSPEKTKDCRLISEAAFDKLQSYTALPDLTLCRECVYQRFDHEMGATKRENMVSGHLSETRLTPDGTIR